MNTQNFCAAPVPTRRERILARLFPNHHCFFPPLPESKDGLVVRTQVALSALDRLRVLVSGRVEVISKTSVEHSLGQFKTNSTVSIYPPKWMEGPSWLVLLVRWADCRFQALGARLPANVEECEAQTNWQMAKSCVIFLRMAPYGVFLHVACWSKTLRKEIR